MTLNTLTPDEIPDRPQVKLHDSSRFGGPPVVGSSPADVVAKAGLEVANSQNIDLSVANTDGERQ